MDLRIGPEEEELISSGFSDNTLGQRIASLTGSYLRRITTANGGWDVLFQDPQDVRYWEMPHPQGAMEDLVGCATLPIQLRERNTRSRESLRVEDF
jgi:hypothetical protein